MKTKRQVEAEVVAKEAAAVVAEMVTVRVLPKGDGMISNGVHDPAGGDEVYERGDIFEVDKTIALALEDRGFAEIQQAPRRRAAPVEPVAPATETVVVEG